MTRNQTLCESTQEQLQAICRQISVAHDLDPEIQRELYGHLEDKALAYLSGEEAVTENDAVVLVREHFGTPATLKSLLRAVHHREARVSMLRRLGAAMALFLALGIVGKLLHLGLDFGRVTLISLYQAPASITLPSAFSAVFLSGVLTLTILWWVLIRWQRRLDAGRPVWFITWRASSIRLLLLFLALAYQAAPYVAFEPVLAPAPAPVAYSQVLAIFLVVVGVAVSVGKMLAWLWWCDRPPRTLREMAVGFSVLLSVMLLFTGLVQLPGTLLFITREVPDLSMNASVLLFHVQFSPLPAYAVLLLNPLFDIVRSGYLILFLCGSALAAVTIYTGAKVTPRYLLSNR